MRGITRRMRSIQAPVGRPLQPPGEDDTRQRLAVTVARLHADGSRAVTVPDHLGIDRPSARHLRARGDMAPELVGLR